MGLQKTTAICLILVMLVMLLSALGFSQEPTLIKHLDVTRQGEFRDLYAGLDESLINLHHASLTAESTGENDDLSLNSVESFSDFTLNNDFTIDVRIEEEPNNHIGQSNTISSFCHYMTINEVYGTITGRWDDLDYYNFTTTHNYDFVLMGKWLGKYYNLDQEEDLSITLLDSSGKVMLSSAPVVLDGTEWTAFYYEYLPRGTYYLVVKQTYGQSSRYVDETYGFAMQFFAYSCTAAIPSTPTGPVEGITGSEYRYSSYAPDCINFHESDFQYDWGDGTFSTWSSNNKLKTWNTPGTYTVRARTRCNLSQSVVSDWSPGLTVVIREACVVGAPILTHYHSAGDVLVNYDYAVAPQTCNQDHGVEFRFNWGDGTYSEWSSSVTAYKTWSVLGTYGVRAQVRCAVNKDIASSTASFPIVIEGPPTDLSISVDDPAGGSFSGDGTYVRTSMVTVTAFPETGYAFHRWLNDGVTISRRNPHSFELNEHTNLILQFRRRLQADRISGKDRFETSIFVSQAGWPDNSTDYVLLARSHDFADALAGVPLAYALNAPVLLTPVKTLYASTLSEIQRLGATNVILLGGTSAIGSEVEDLLEAQGLKVERVFGSNRYATAAAIANRLAQITGSLTDAVIAVGSNFPDALSAASYAAYLGQPILLVHSTTLPASTENVLIDLNIQNVVIAGGTSVVSNAVMDALPVPGKKTRVSGSTRYATSVEMIHYFAPESKRFFIATGVNFPDAITGAVLAAKEKSGIFLLYGPAPIPSFAVQDYLVDESIEAVTLFGGSSAICNEVQQWF
jgi:putative cell wall-binding protein